MKYLAPILCCFLITGCPSINNDHYKNVDEFKAEISTWNIIGKFSSDANKIAVLKGFSCDNKFCYKYLSGFPCNQRLRVNFTTSMSGIVQSYQVWEINGKLPSQCL